MFVSVIIPAYNVENYISACLESALNQTYKEIEIICVDDGSTDATSFVLSSYFGKYPDKIRIITQNNSGATKSRNNGLQIAKGDYIQFLDADDVLLPEKIEHQVAMILVNQNRLPDFIAASYTWNFGKKKTFPAQFIGNRWIDLVRGTLGNTCSNIWKLSALNKVGGWDQFACSSQETDLMFRMLKLNPLVLYDTRRLTVINVRASGSISSKNRAENYCRFINIRRAIFKYLNGKNLLTDQFLYEYNKIVFNTIRLLYPYNSQKAVWYYKDIFAQKMGLLSLGHSSFLYKVLFFMFGFRRTEQIIVIFKGT